MVTVSSIQNNENHLLPKTGTAQYNLLGLSTDTKPTTVDGYQVAQNSLFLELDTGDFYYFNGSSWAKIGE